MIELTRPYNFAILPHSTASRRIGINANLKRISLYDGYTTKPICAMKVLAIIDNLSNGGGAERLLVSLLPALLRRGVRCDLAVIRDDHDLAEELESSGIRIHKLGVERLWSLHSSVLRLNRICHRENYDILWGNSYFGNLNAMLLRLLQPKRRALVFLQSAGYTAHPPKSLGHFLSMKIERISGRYLSSRIVAVSRAMADDYRLAMGWEDISVVNNCVSVKTLPPPMPPEHRPATRRSFGIPEDVFLLVVPARFVPMKGHTVLLDALALLAKERAWRPFSVLAGRGPLLESLKDKAHGCGLDATVRFVDTLPQQHLFRMMQAADAVVLPSLYEPFGIAAAESMAMGIPTVVTDAYGFRDLVGEGDSAFKSLPGDARSLADALWRVHGDAALRAEVAVAGRKRIQDNFDADTIASAWHKIFAATIA